MLLLLEFIISYSITKILVQIFKHVDSLACLSGVDILLLVTIHLL